MTPLEFPRLFIRCLIVLNATGNGWLGAEEAGTKGSAPFTPPPSEVPEGFTVELVAGLPLVKYPMMAARR